MSPSAPTEWDLLAIRGGRVVSGGTSAEADVVIKGDRIWALTAPGALSASIEIDARGQFVVPGGIDPHVHAAVPFGEFTSLDSFYSCSVAAAHGGTTTIVDFALPYPRDMWHPIAAAEARRAEAADAVIDVALHSAITLADAQSIREIPTLISKGITTFKVFTAYPGAVMLGLDDLLTVVGEIGRHGGLAVIHAESSHIIESLRSEFAAAGTTTPRYHALSRPPVSEYDMVRSAIEVLGATGGAAYFVHLSTPESVAAVAAARSRGIAVWAETCPHYLVLDESVYERSDAELFVCSPPMRDRVRAEGLWRQVAAGDVALVGSDHSCYDTAQKRLYMSDFRRMPNGLPGVETRCPLLFSEGVMKGRISIERFVELTSAGPARLTGLHHRKGAIAPGLDADVVVWDPAKRTTLEADTLHMETDYTPFAGLEIQGWPSTVIAAGRVVVDHGTFRGARGAGRYLARRLPDRGN